MVDTSRSVVASRPLSQAVAHRLQLFALQECRLAPGEAIDQVDRRRIGNRTGLVLRLGIAVGRRPHAEELLRHFLMIGAELVRRVADRQRTVLQPQRLVAAEIKQRPIVGRHVAGHDHLDCKVQQRQPPGHHRQHAPRTLDRIGFGGPEDDDRLETVAGMDPHAEVVSLIGDSSRRPL